MRGLFDENASREPDDNCGSGTAASCLATCLAARFAAAPGTTEKALSRNQERDFDDSLRVWTVHTHDLAKAIFRKTHAAEAAVKIGGDAELILMHAIMPRMSNPYERS